MEPEKPVFSFPYEYAGQLYHCEVVMLEEGYDVFFDGRWMAGIAHTEDWTWIQSSGVILPDLVIEEIGFRVESEYNNS